MRSLLAGPAVLVALSGCTAAPVLPDVDTGPSETGTALDPTEPYVPHGPPTIVYAVRHAEKGAGDDPDLSEEGEARAQALVDVLHEAPLVAVYATDLVRTQQTVAPTAADHGLPVVTDIDPDEELAAHILASHAGTSVLHAGHSYTLGRFMDALGVADFPSIGGYGDLWTVTIVGSEVTLETSSFGDP